jgi:hypothetical protein
MADYLIWTWREFPPLFLAGGLDYGGGRSVARYQFGTTFGTAYFL